MLLSSRSIVRGTSKLSRTQAYHTLATRTPSFLADAEWLETPWESQPKHLDDQIVDILLTVPRFLAQTDAARAEAHPLRKLVGILHSAQLCWDTDSALRKWRARLDAVEQGPLFRSEPSKLDTAADDDESGKLFPIAYRFPSFVLAQTMVIFWTCQTLVGSHLCRLYQGLSNMNADPNRLRLAPCTCKIVDSSSSADPEVRIQTCVRHFALDKLPPLGSHEDWVANAAYEICRSAEFFLEENTRGFGPSCFFPTLRILRFLWRVLPGDWTRELVWIEDIVARIQARGNNVARFTRTEADFYTRGGRVPGGVLAPISIDR